MRKKKNPQIFLGFDFGMKRIGVALGNSFTESARPLLTLAAKDGIPDWNQIESLIKTWNVSEIIVGMPYTLDNKDQEITHAARRFKNRLRQKFKLATHEVEEQYTTKIARTQLNANDDIDNMAAIILQAWLDSDFKRTNSGD